MGEMDHQRGVTLMQPIFREKRLIYVITLPTNLDIIAICTQTQMMASVAGRTRPPKS